MATRERIVDQQYLQLLENKLKSLKSPQKITAKTFLSDIASYKDHQLFKLITERDEPIGFEDNFINDVPINPTLIRRKIAPQTCAINRMELVKLIQAESAPPIHSDFDKDEFSKELKEVAEAMADSKFESIYEDSDIDRPSTEESTTAASPEDKSE